MGCLFHKWNGCQCEKCGATQATGHSFAPNPQRKTQVCAACGHEAVDLSCYSQGDMDTLKTALTFHLAGLKNLGVKKHPEYYWEELSSFQKDPHGTPFPLAAIPTVLNALQTLLLQLRLGNLSTSGEWGAHTTRDFEAHIRDLMKRLSQTGEGFPLPALVR